MVDAAIKYDPREWADMQRRLALVGARVAARVAGKASRKGLNVVLRSAKQKVTKRTGLLKKSLAVIQKKYKHTGTIYNLVGPRRDMKDPQTGENPANIAHLVEFGTAPHTMAPKGMAGSLKIKRREGPQVHVRGEIEHPGARAKPFLRPAYDERGREAINVTFHEFDKGVDEEVRKAKR
jgi:HK97 gp10 family phage protein